MDIEEYQKYDEHQSFWSTGEHWTIGHDLKRNPDRMLYLTDEGYAQWFGRPVGDKLIVELMKPLLNGISVGDYLKVEEKIYTRGGKWPAELAAQDEEDLEHYRHLAGWLLEDWVTTDPREAHMGFRDKYTGPKD